MTAAANSGKTLNEIRTQNAEFQTQLIDSATTLGPASIDLTSVTTSYVAWVHPVDASVTITYYGKQVFQDQNLVTAGYGDDIAVGDLKTVSITSPFPINLKECVVTSTSGVAKVSFGRL